MTVDSADAPTAPSPQAEPPRALDLLAAAVAAVPGGAARPGQQRMAAAIEEAIARREHLLVQAGTGTGKSLGYLAPALTVDGPVVVSTATLALQSQLVEHDVPRLVTAVEPLLGRRPTFAVLKGRHHYLCLAKLENSTEEEPEETLFDASSAGTWLGEASRLSRQIQRLRDWAMETETGDRDELDPGVDDRAWRLASISARECVGAARCPYGAECFAEAARLRARSADIVVTNHSLLAVDLLAGGHIIPPHRVLIIDEAHELVDRVSAAAQAELTPEALERAARRTRPLLGPETTAALDEAGDGLAVALADAPTGWLANGLPDDVRAAVTVVESAARAAREKLGAVSADDPDPVRKQQARAALDEIVTTAQRLLDESAQDVAWIAQPERAGPERRALVVAPLSVAGTLASTLYADRTVIFTSATLALGGRFDTVARALGLPPRPASTPATTATAATPSSDGPGDTPSPDRPGDAAESAPPPPADARPAPDGPPWRALDVDSPYDYARQGILYVAAHLPRPTASGLSEAAGEELLALIEALGGRTLGLFSSRRAAHQAAELVRSRTDLTVLLQGEDALPALVRRFREERSSCLFGVMSLWQGVDVPGESCQLVVIDRLPFPRPDEPLPAARAAAVDAAGGSGFAAVSVPIAAVRLAQGVGRLIRSPHDRGVVAVLDSRLATARGYGPFLRRSLPPLWYTTRPDVVRGALRRLAQGGRPDATTGR